MKCTLPDYDKLNLNSNQKEYLSNLHLDIIEYLKEKNVIDDTLKITDWNKISILENLNKELEIEAIKIIDDKIGINVSEVRKEVNLDINYETKFSNWTKGLITTDVISTSTPNKQDTVNTELHKRFPLLYKPLQLSYFNYKDVNMNMTLHEFSNAYISKLKDSNLELYETIINDFQDINNFINQLENYYHNNFNEDTVHTIRYFYRKMSEDLRLLFNKPILFESDIDPKLTIKELTLNSYKKSFRNTGNTVLDELTKSMSNRFNLDIKIINPNELEFPEYKLNQRNDIFIEDEDVDINYDTNEPLYIEKEELNTVTNFTAKELIKAGNFWLSNIKKEEYPNSTLNLGLFVSLEEYYDLSFYLYNTETLEIVGKLNLFIRDEQFSIYQSSIDKRFIQTSESLGQILYRTINYALKSYFHQPLISRGEFIVENNKYYAKELWERLIKKDLATHNKEDNTYEMLRQIRHFDNNAYFDLLNNTIYLINGRADNISLLHELGHAFLHASKKENKDLYDNLVKEATSNKHVTDYVKKVYGLTEGYEFEHESVAYALELYSKQSFDKFNNKFLNLLDDFWNMFSNYIKSIFNLESVNINQLNPNMTIKDLHDLIVFSKVNINLNNLPIANLTTYSQTKNTDVLMSMFEQDFIDTFGDWINAKKAWDSLYSIDKTVEKRKELINKFNLQEEFINEDFSPKLFNFNIPITYYPINQDGQIKAIHKYYEEKKNKDSLLNLIESIIKNNPFDFIQITNNGNIRVNTENLSTFIYENHLDDLKDIKPIKVLKEMIDYRIDSQWSIKKLEIENEIELLEKEINKIDFDDMKSLYQNITSNNIFTYQNFQYEFENGLLVNVINIDDEIEIEDYKLPLEILKKDTFSLYHLNQIRLINLNKKINELKYIDSLLEKTLIDVKSYSESDKEVINYFINEEVVKSLSENRIMDSNGFLLNSWVFNPEQLTVDYNLHLLDIREKLDLIEEDKFYNGIPLKYYRAFNLFYKIDNYDIIEANFNHNNFDFMDIIESGYISDLKFENTNNYNDLVYLLNQKVESLKNEYYYNENMITDLLINCQ